MTVVDVDCHFEFAGPAEAHPLRDMADKFPATNDYLTDVIAGDLLKALPPDSGLDTSMLGLFLPPENQAAAAHACEPGCATKGFVSSAEERIAWMNDIGIDIALINPGALGFLTDFLGPDRPRAIRRCNDFLAD